MITPRTFVVLHPAAEKVKAMAEERAEDGARLLKRVAASRPGPSPDPTLRTGLAVALARKPLGVAPLIVHLHAQLVLRIIKGNARLS